MTAMRGAEGQPGRAGAEGSTGRAGAEGHDGAQGETGETGETGKVGRAGPRGQSFTRVQMLVIFGFVVLSFVVLAFFFQRQQSALTEEVRRAGAIQYRLCVIAEENAIGLRETFELVIENAEALPASPDRDRSIESYRNAIPEIPNCPLP